MTILYPKRIVESLRSKCEAQRSRSQSKGYKQLQCTGCSTQFWAYHKIKQRRCCACRALYVARKFTIVVQDGYPSQHKFQTMNEVDAYLGEPKIKCLLCGNSFEALFRHVQAYHDMSPREYQRQFGIPYGRKLITAQLQERMREKANDRIAAGTLTTSSDPNRLTHMLNNRTTIGRPVHSPAATAASYHGIPKEANITRTRTELIEAFCTQCGNSAGMKPAYVIIMHGCKLLCSTCRTIRHREHTKNYYHRSKAQCNQNADQ